MTKKYNVAVLLPTRGRTNALDRSVRTLIDNAHNIDNVQFMFGFDRDDKVGLEHFQKNLKVELDQGGVKYVALQFDRLGYINIDKYYTQLAKTADADWLFIWNDDAFMITPGWDQVIKKYTGQMRVLKVHTHNEHPYSIFPIGPRLWFDTLTVLSRHQMIDAELSQHAYMIDVMQIVDIHVTHAQSELTGHHDSTSQRKNRLEGNPLDPRDFHFASTTRQRIADCKALNEIKRAMQLDTTFLERILTGDQDPWEKLKKNDINGHMYQFETRI
jgi:hypothetical protein